MRKFTYLKSLLLLCALIVGGGTSWAADKWVKTAPADLATGDIVVIVDQTSSKAMANNGGTSSAPSATAVTLNDGKSEITSEVAATLQWEVTVSNGSYQFGVADTENYLYCTSTNNGVRVGTNANNAFTVKDNDDVDFLLNTATSRYIGVYNSQDWRCYTSINANIKNTVTAFYKKTSSDEPDKTAPTLVVEDLSMYVEQEKNLVDLYLIDDDYAGEVTFGSSDEAVAKVDGDVLKAVAAGTATITVTAAADANYKMATETFTVTVKSKDVAPEGAAAGVSYVLVTDDSSLADGDKFIIVCTSKGMVMGAQSGTKCDNIAVTITDDCVAGANLPAGANVVTLEAATDGWYLKTDQGYLTSTAAKSIKVEADKADASIVTITIDTDNNAEIGFGEEVGTLQYNANSPRFCTYTSSQTAVQLYRYTETSTFDITMGSNGYRTIVSAKSVTLPAGLEAYVVSANAEGKATLLQVDGMVANEPYILKGAAGTYTLTISDAVSAPTINQLRISDSSTGAGVYVLAKHGSSVGFYKWNGGSLGAGRVYLPAEAASAEYDFISLDGDGIETGIQAMDNMTVLQSGDCYDLSGRKVVKSSNGQMAKGLYIVNGKKVVIK